MLLRVGSRGSRLALTQAERAVSFLRAPGIELVLVPITTAGDRDRSRPFGEIGSTKSRLTTSKAALRCSRAPERRSVTSRRVKSGASTSRCTPPRT